MKYIFLTTSSISQRRNIMQKITYNIANQKMYNHIKLVLNEYGGKIETITLENISKNNIFFEDVVIITGFNGYFKCGNDICSIQIEPCEDYKNIRVAVWHNAELLTSKYKRCLCEFNLVDVLDEMIDKIKAKKETESETAPF